MNDEKENEFDQKTYWQIITVSISSFMKNILAILEEAMTEYLFLLKNAVKNTKKLENADNSNIYKIFISMSRAYKFSDQTILNKKNKLKLKKIIGSKKNKNLLDLNK